MQKCSSLIFLGDSLTQFHNWSDFGEHHNAGIAGDTTDGLLYRLHYTLGKKPTIVVLMIGINDLLQGQHLEIIQENYHNILTQLQDVKHLYILSTLPVEATKQTTQINEDIIRLNHYLRLLSNTLQYHYIDLYSLMVDKNLGMKQPLTSDGVHLTAKAYDLWEQKLKHHIPLIR